MCDAKCYFQLFRIHEWCAYGEQVNMIFYENKKVSSSSRADRTDKLSASEFSFILTNKHTMNTNIQIQIEINFDDKIVLFERVFARGIRQNSNHLQWMRASSNFFISMCAWLALVVVEV